LTPNGLTDVTVGVHQTDRGRPCSTTPLAVVRRRREGERERAISSEGMEWSREVMDKDRRTDRQEAASAT